MQIPSVTCDLYYLFPPSQKMLIISIFSGSPGPTSQKPSLTSNIIQRRGIVRNSASLFVRPGPGSSQRNLPFLANTKLYFFLANFPPSSSKNSIFKIFFCTRDNRKFVITRDSTEGRVFFIVRLIWLITLTCKQKQKIIIVNILNYN